MTVSDAQFSRLEQQVDEARHTGDKAEAQITTHEAVCAERYKQIQTNTNAINAQLVEIQAHFDKRLRIRDALQVVTLAAVLLGPGAAAEFLKKLAGL